jgi:hypothetical protein
VFLTLRWTTLEKVLIVSGVRRWLYLVAKPFHSRVDVDELSCPCTILLPMDVGLECRVIGLRLFFLI